jgi:murein DD-endopeptidase MepM/ murein hydrolase activator NlpD
MRRILTVLVLLATLAAAPAAHAWIWPVEGTVLRPFSLGPSPYEAGQHRGVDIGAAVGDTVLAPVAGTISFVGSIPGGGHAVTIQTPDGYAVTLLQLGSTSVLRGSVVSEGTAVGVVGESADAVTSAPHVHLGVRVASDPNG